MRGDRGAAQVHRRRDRQGPIIIIIVINSITTIAIIIIYNLIYIYIFLHTMI